MPKILNFVKKIHYYSELFTSLLGHGVLRRAARGDPRDGGGDAAGRGGPLDPEAGAKPAAEAAAPKRTTYGTGSKAAAAAPTAAANELHEALHAGPQDMADATKPPAAHLPLQTDVLPDPSKALGVQQRKCDSEREEWCDVRVRVRVS